MRVFLINLACRPDRLSLMETQLSSLELPFSRIDAVDGLGDSDIGYPDNHPILSKAEYACYLSHLKLWQAFVETGDSHCLVLEDDVVLAKSIPNILRHKSFFQHNAALTRLERHRHSSLISKFAHGRFKSRRLVRMFEFEGSSGAYVLSRNFALYLIKHHSKPEIPADHILLDHRRTHFKKHIIYMLDPAAACQRHFLDPSDPDYDTNSDLMPTRIKMPTPARKTAVQKVLHFFLIQIFRNIRHNLFRTRKFIRFSKD